jgi:broad specificity phosphatase PhoE
VILHLVRHGETAFNRDGRGLGRADEPLTAVGLRQAAALGVRFEEIPLDRVLTSPLSRARGVARALVGERGIEPVSCLELIEMDVGETEGLAFAEVRARFPELMAQWAGDSAHAARMPGGESILDVDQRVAPLIEQLPAFADAELALVSHNFVLRVILCRLLGLDLAAFRRFSLDLASVTKLSYARGRWSLVTLNDTCHLRSLER